MNVSIWKWGKFLFELNRIVQLINFHNINNKMHRLSIDL